jgi:quercetin dioxygenase-like cupin family protein
MNHAAHPLSAVHAIDWEQMTWKPVRPGIERKAFGSETVTVALHKLQPGHEPRPHSHPNEQIVYILSGCIDFHVGNEVVRLRSGGLLVVPPDVEHYGIVVGDEEVLNLDIFTPARPEYLA